MSKGEKAISKTKHKEEKMKKRILVLLVLLAAAGLLFATGQQEKAEVLELKGGTAAYLFQGMPLNDIAASYNAAHPEVNVELIPFPEDWAAVTSKLQLEAARQTATYDFITAAAAFLDVATAGKLGIIEPIDEYLSQEVRNDMLPSIRQEMLMDDQMYAFPMVTDVVGFIYRISYLEKGGYSNPPATWDELLTYCEKLDRVFAGQEIWPLGFDWYWRPWGGYIPILQSYTDEPFPGGRTDTWSSAAEKTLELMKAYYPYMPPSAAGNLEASQAFQAGAVAMEIYWQPQMLRAIQAGQPEDDLKMVSTPKGTRGGTVFWSTGYMLTKYGKDKQACVDFFSEALRSREFYAGAINNWKLLPFSSAYTTMEDQLLPFFPDLISRLESGEAVAIPNTGYMMAAELDVMREELTKLMDDEQTVQQTMDNMTDRITKKIEEME
jgi:ABC-type glycerol-3-phosphate transport system substrate-binding protein